MHHIGTSSLQQRLPAAPVNIQAMRNPQARQPQSPDPTVHMLSAATREHVFRYVRNLSGVVGHELTPSTMTTMSSALNPAINHYLWAHGYQPGSIQLIQEIYERARDMSAFVDDLAGAGIPIAEGRYIYSLIRGKQ